MFYADNKCHMIYELPSGTASKREKYIIYRSYIKINNYVQGEQNIIYMLYTANNMETDNIIPTVL